MADKFSSDLNQLKRDFRNSINTAIIAAFGLLMALSWNSLIGDWAKGIASASPLQGQLFSTLIITVIAVVGIFITTRIFSPKKTETEEKK